MPEEAEFLDHVRIEDAHMLGKKESSGFSTKLPPKYCFQCTGRTFSEKKSTTGISTILK